MRTLFCDVCGDIIPENKTQFIVGINETKVNNVDTSEDYFNPKPNPLHSGQMVQNVRIYHFCDTCKGILDMLLNSNQQEVAKMKEELNALMKRKTVKEKVIKEKKHE